MCDSYLKLCLPAPVRYQLIIYMEFRKVRVGEELVLGQIVARGDDAVSDITRFDEEFAFSFGYVTEQLRGWRNSLPSSALHRPDHLCFRQ